MADKEKLAAERIQLSVRKKKLELTVTNEETVSPNEEGNQVPGSSIVDFLFKIVLIGDAVSCCALKLWIVWVINRFLLSSSRQDRPSLESSL